MLGVLGLLCYCCGLPTTVVCLNKLINTYLNHWPLISACQYCISRMAHTRAWIVVLKFVVCAQCVRAAQRIVEFDVIFWFSVAYYVLSTHHRFCRNSSLAVTHTAHKRSYIWVHHYFYLSFSFHFPSIWNRTLRDKNSLFPLFANLRCSNATINIFIRAEKMQFLFQIRRRANDCNKNGCRYACSGRLMMANFSAARIVFAVETTNLRQIFHRVCTTNAEAYASVFVYDDDDGWLLTIDCGMCCLTFDVPSFWKARFVLWPSWFIVLHALKTHGEIV